MSTPATAAAPGHPIRQAIPRPEPLTEAPPREDLKLFALSFTAFFICFYTFLM